MNKVQIKNFNDKLKKLEDFATEKIIIDSNQNDNYSERAIIDWISECVNLFYAIGVDGIVIKHFLDYFSFNITEVETDTTNQVVFPGFQEKKKQIKNIGPFRQNSNYFGVSNTYHLSGSFYYAKIAFSSARNILKNNIDEKRIVPLWLIELLSENDKTKHISSSLELMEEKYNKRNSEGLIIESNTILDNILNLDPLLKKSGNLKKKLDELIKDTKKMESLGINKELLEALNSGRIIRNKKIVHKEIPIRYNLPFIIATSFAYLVIFFIECLILNSDTFLEKK